MTLKSKFFCTPQSMWYESALSQSELLTRIRDDLSPSLPPGALVSVRVHSLKESQEESTYRSKSGRPTQYAEINVHDPESDPVLISAEYSIEGLEILTVRTFQVI